MLKYINKAGLRAMIILAVVTALVAGCTKSTQVKWVNYDETYCADRWTYDSNNENLKENITAYCHSKGIKILEMEIFDDGTPEACQSCNCKTGRRIRCKIKKSDLENIKKEGFYE